jgi:hypothetical protein
MNDRALEAYWRTYLRVRFNAFRSLLKIIGYQSNAVLEPEYSQCDTIDKFAVLWQAVIDPGERRGSLKRDAIPWIIQIENGDMIDIRFIPSDEQGGKLKVAEIAKPLMSFLKAASGIKEDNPVGDDLVYQRTELITGKRLILVSMAELEGAAKNSIVEFNMYLQHPIRFFSIEELQFDPTTHVSAPKFTRVLTEAEKRQFINAQIGLGYGTTHIVPDFEGQMAQQQDRSAQIDFQNYADNEVLKRVPTMNTSAPLVKWKGYKVGDIIYIERWPYSKTTVTYRRVVYLDPVPIKPPKVNTQLTKN